MEIVIKKDQENIAKPLWYVIILHVSVSPTVTLSDSTKKSTKTVEWALGLKDKI
jgi:hypothetical protein